MATACCVKRIFLKHPCYSEMFERQRGSLKTEMVLPDIRLITGTIPCCCVGRAHACCEHTLSLCLHFDLLPFLPRYISWYLFVLWSWRAAKVENPECTRGIFQTPSLSRLTRPVALLSWQRYSEHLGSWGLSFVSAWSSCSSSGL